MSLGICMYSVDKGAYDLCIYSNPPYGYYIKKYHHKTGLLEKVSRCIEDHDIAVRLFHEMLKVN